MTYLQSMNDKAEAPSGRNANNNAERLARLGRATLALQKINRVPGSYSESDLNNLLQTLVDIIYKELAYPNCQIFLTTPDGTELNFMCGRGFLMADRVQRELIKEWRPKLNDDARRGLYGLVGWTATHLQPLNIPDVLADSRYLTFEPGGPVRSELTVPLVSTARLIGVLDLQSTALNAFDSLDLEIISFFASQAASLVHTAQLDQASSRSSTDLNLLARTSSGVNSAITPNEIGMIVLKNLVQALQAASGNIISINPTSRSFKRLLNYNLPESFGVPAMESSPVLWNIIDKRQPAFFSTIEESGDPPEALLHLHEVGIEAFCCLPLYIRDEILGALFINYSEPHIFTESEKHLIKIFTEQAAAALFNARISSREQAFRRSAESLVRSSRMISSQLDPEAVLQTILEEVCTVLGTPLCTIARIGESGDEITEMVSYGFKPETEAVKIKYGQGFIGSVASRGQLWKEYDMALVPQFKNTFVRVHENIHGALALPIRIGGSNGQVIGVLCTYDTVPRDFTDWEIGYLEGLADHAAVAIKNAENYVALKRERDMYQALLENANDAIFLLDPATGQVIDANQKATISTGYEYAEIIGMPVQKLYPPEEQSKIELMQTQQMLEGDRAATIVDNITALRKDCTTFPASYSARLVQVGQDRIIIQIVRDMSERRTMEQQLVRHEQLKVLGQLAGGVAHDFNNLLTGILGLSELLLNGVPDDDERRLLRMIRQSALDGAQMVRRVQMLGPKHGASELSLVDLNNLLRDVLELTRSRWRREAQQRGAFIEVELETETLPPVNANASELREVVTNLILNAVDAMPLGGKLRISTSQKENRVNLVVADTGTGMSEETKRHLFEPFYTTKAKEGHGLGLSVSNSIIARHGGNIEVNSILGLGSRFTITLPLSEAQAPEPETQPETTAQALRVLIIDDEPSLLYVLKRGLQADQHQVTALTSGQEAIDLFIRQPYDFDLVFTDLSIGDLNGWQVAKAIKSIRPDLPVLLVTGWGAELNSEMLKEYDIAEVIAKPYRFNDVRLAIQRAISKNNQGNLS
ncbi:MAG TPA: GAF domain-containing protein [Chloroflexia bacterium]|nr:GAF domain-containing protein [Chloroflexia bacterium]